MSKFPDYYNRFSPTKNWERVLFRADRGGQSAEMNELQDVLSDRIDRLGRGIYQDGHVVEGADCVVLPGLLIPIPGISPNIKLTAGRIALRGTVYEVEETLLRVPDDKLVWIGIRFHTVEQSEFDDPALLNPALGTRGYAEPGAGRLKAEWQWGWQADDGTTDENSDWDFFPVYEVDHGVFVLRRVPPGNDPLLNLLAKYDREAHGNYVVRGFDVKFIEETAESSDEPSNYIFDVSDGLADIQGYKTERRPNTRMVWPKDPELVGVIGEPHHYDGTPVPPGHPPPAPTGPDIPVPGGVPPPSGQHSGRRETIFLNRTPVVGVTRILATIYKATSITKGAANGEDELPDASIVNVIQVDNGPGNVIYAEGISWQLDGDKIDWSLGGPEPSPGTTLNVYYSYEVDLMSESLLPGGINNHVVEIGSDHIVIQGVYPSTFVYVDYSWALARKDLIILNVSGELVRLIGVSQLRNPTAPRPSEDQVALATVDYDWATDPKVTDVSPRTIPMTELKTMRTHIFDLYELVAIVALRGDQSLQGEAERLGIFVDPFVNDDNRDFGVEQEATVFEGTLQLPVPSTPNDPNGAAEQSYWTLGFTLEELVAQPAKTGCLAIVPINVVPPPIIEPPPPIPPRPPPEPRPPPRPHPRPYIVAGNGWATDRGSSITGARADDRFTYNGLPPYGNHAGVIYGVNHSLFRLDTATKANIQALVDLMIDNATYWGDDTYGGNHDKSGVATIGGQQLTWQTHIEKFFYNFDQSPPAPVNVGVCISNRGFEWEGVVPSNATINAKIAALKPEIVADINNQIDAQASWDAGFKTAVHADFNGFMTAHPLVIGQLNHEQFTIENQPVHIYSSTIFWPNIRRDAETGQMVHALYIWTDIDHSAGRHNFEIYHANVLIRGVSGVGDGDPGPHRPPRRGIHEHPPTQPSQQPPVAVPPEDLDEETVMDAVVLPIRGTGFQPGEIVAAATIDDIDVVLRPLAGSSEGEQNTEITE